MNPPPLDEKEDARMVASGERPTLSFVVPAHDEEDSIERCVVSIGRFAPEGLSREVIVVDNGSKDQTANVARKAGATVVSSNGATIAAARNDGVRTSRGDVLVFLDADCALTEGWGEEFTHLLERIHQVHPCCAGSQVFPPPDESVFLWKYWFEPFVTQGSASHVGSAHMICARDAFHAVGGFDESLETGEDFDFCARIRRAGGEVLNVPALRVDHYGFPRTWRQFFRRERWHGRGDAMSLTTFLSSKVAVASVSFVALFVVGVLAGAAGFGLGGWLSLCGAMLVLLAASIVKFRHAGLRVHAMSLMILPVYFLARSFSVADALRRRLSSI